jgi:hypothetical protein
MSVDPVGSGDPNAVFEPIAPLLRTQAAQMNVASSDKVVLPARKVDQSKITVHLTKRHRRRSGAEIPPLVTP